MALGLAKPCFGSTIALRRETLERIGGFAAFKDVLADDYAIGRGGPPPRPRGRGAGDLVLGPSLRRDDAGPRCSGRNCAGRARSGRRSGRASSGSIVTHPLPLATIALSCPAVSASAACVLVRLRLGGAAAAAACSRRASSACGRRPFSRPGARLCGLPDLRHEFLARFDRLARPSLRAPAGRDPRLARQAGS